MTITELEALRKGLIEVSALHVSSRMEELVIHSAIHVVTLIIQRMK